MKCTTQRCPNDAEVGIVTPRTGEWWRPLPNPAPFCEPCQRGERPPRQYTNAWEALYGKPTEAVAA